jgi:hypothetical protein
VSALKPKIEDVSNDPLTRERLVCVQKEDQELALLWSKSFSLEELENVPVYYFMKDIILLQKWRPPDATVEVEWKVVYQIVVTEAYRREVMSLAHDSPMDTHIEANKTYTILTHFHRPNIRRDVAKHCRTCHTCYVVGKPNQKFL